MVDINTVYTTTLQILNKEQRGYVTPAEFNSLAAQVQLEIFESYFPDGSQLNRQNQNNTQNDTQFFNIFKNQEEKLAPFVRDLQFNFNNERAAWNYNPENPNDDSNQEAEFVIYWTGEILSSYKSSLTGNTSPQASTSGGQFITQLVSKSDFNKITRSKLTAPTEKFPIAYVDSGIFQPGYTPFYKISPVPNEVEVNCIVLPRAPRWGFIQGLQGQYVFSPQGSTNFDLAPSEQTNLIIGILKYAGVIINDPTIIDVATQEAAEVQANEKS
tara:strand:- start:613 stop:1425 length:813 start_codon:yes stop_codon:yes gene_type:complete